ncbi:MAG: hypothetical protein KDA88_17405 [Planctomycetaceae bacterium]|nr:hypothetical protein [Planctomycetaceae bacterium]MCB9953589.1 hypothetical protein [Planctomycetaceae bacterium]
MSFLNRVRELFAKPQKRRGPGRGRRVESLEDRTLLAATLNLTPAGSLNYGGSGVANNLTISFDGTNYTFTDTSEQINGIGGVTGLDTNPDPNIFTFNPTLAVPAITQIVINTNAGDDIITLDSMRTGGEGFDVRNDPAEGNDTININGDIGSDVDPVLANVLLRAETVNLNANIYVGGTADVRVEGPANLISDVEIIAIPDPTQAITFTGTINGPGGLIARAANMEFQSEIGGVSPVDHFEGTGHKLTVKDVTVTGDMTIVTDLLTLSPPLTTWTGGGTFAIAPFTPGGDMVLPQDQIAVFGFTALELGNADTNSITIVEDVLLPVDTTFTAATVNVNRQIDNGGAPTRFITNELNANFRIIGDGDLEVGGLVPTALLTINGQLGGNGWGNSNVSVMNGDGGVIFNNAFGSHVMNFTVDSAGDVEFTSAQAVNASGDISITSALGEGTITLPAGVQAPAGGINLDGVVELTGTGTFRVGAGSDFFAGGINANGNNVYIRGVGGAINLVDIFDVVGANLFRIDSSGGSTAVEVLLSSVDALDINVRALDIDLFGDLTAAANVSLIGNVGVDENVVITSGGASTNRIQIGGLIDAVDGDESLTLNGGVGRVILAGETGGTTPLVNFSVISGGSHYITQDITVSGMVSWNNSGQLVNRATITAPGGATLIGTPFINQGTIV